MTFDVVDEPTPGRRWLELFETTWPSYERWFLAEGDGARPSYLACRRALMTHLPELVPLWEAHVDLAGGGDRAARLLSLYRPTPFIGGCSQLAMTEPEPLLIRNYDYHPERCEGRITRTAWAGDRVVAKSDCLWGALDGVNEHGLVASLAFGGRPAVGDGFGIPLLVRYVLTFARDVTDAVARLSRVPCHMAYNVTLIDTSGDARTLELAPDRAPRTRPRPLATNHQADTTWAPFHRHTLTREREHHLESLADRSPSGNALIERFLAPPLYATQWQHGFGTLYGVRYRARQRAATFFWPGARLELSVDRSDQLTLDVHLGRPHPGSLR